MTTLTACLRCREQKLKCTREKPICKRCYRLNAACTYPAPPNRKLLASKRAPARERCRVRTGISNDFVATNDISSSLPTPGSQASPGSVWATQNATDIDIPDPDLQAGLIDLYFACAFNASLIFHRPTFMSLFSTGDLSMCSLLAVCAMATHFLGSQTAATIDSLQSARIDVLDIQARGKKWASSAGRNTLQCIDQPELEHLQICQILSMYWFAVGELNRNAMFAVITLRAARVLLSSFGKRGGRKPSGEHSWTSVQLEMLRRGFWAAWTMNCVNADHYVIGSSADTWITRLPLPVNNTMFENATHEGLAPVTIADRQALDGSSSTAHPVSVWAELMRIVFLWTKVRDHIENRNGLLVREWLPRLFEIDQELNDWASSLPSSLSYSKRHLYEHLILKQEPIYTEIHALHHQCRIVLHGSLSSTTSESRLPLRIVQGAQEMVHASAKDMSEMAANILVLDCDPAQFSPVFGYLLYACITAQLACLRSSRARPTLAASVNLRSCGELLDRMAPHWYHIRKLRAKLGPLQSQINKLGQAVTEDTNVDGTISTGYTDIPISSRGLGTVCKIPSDALQYSLRDVLDPAEANDLSDEEGLSTGKSGEGATALSEIQTSDISQTLSGDFMGGLFGEDNYLYSTNLFDWNFPDLSGSFDPPDPST